MTSSTLRPSWCEIWLDVAHIIARRSLCSRDQVGAVIVSATNRIVSTGYNGPPSGFEHDEKPCTQWCKRSLMAQQSEKHGLSLDYTDCPSSHAEANALSVCDRSVREGGTIYVTSHCCMGCAKLIANSGLAVVHVRSSAQSLHRQPNIVYEFLEKCGITVYVS